ncbi:hypothetical protein Ddye_024053 [Dipteronia dyeriana]|uniref:Uncharacterized protein n=1 Tax=Dipteronia dyeriana TaxID=168575 RepID=A0AAD9TU28_9ROSI|nr:hypothetical protein Ddye_024053 [Dipteronia dyeriana]
MRRDLFLRILSNVEARDVYFMQRDDATSRSRMSRLQKMTVAIRLLSIRLLSYGYVADCCDEYLQIGETTVVESMKHFCDVVITLYESQYMQAPNTENVTRLLQEGDARGFPGIFRSLNCMHWEWKIVPLLGMAHTKVIIISLL